MYSLIGNVLGTPDNPAGYVFGNPNMGNGDHSGTAQPSKGLNWADWGKAPGPSGFQELDLDVEATTIRAGNYIYGASGAVEESLSGLVLPPSLFRTAKPSWFGECVWPPIDAGKPNLMFSAIPAGRRYMGVVTPAPVPDPTPTPVPTPIPMPPSDLPPSDAKQGYLYLKVALEGGVLEVWVPANTKFVPRT